MREGKYFNAWKFSCLVGKRSEWGQSLGRGKRRSCVARRGRKNFFFLFFVMAKDAAHCSPTAREKRNEKIKVFGSSPARLQQMMGREREGRLKFTIHTRSRRRHNTEKKNPSFLGGKFAFLTSPLFSLLLLRRRCCQQHPQTVLFTQKENKEIKREGKIFAPTRAFSLCCPNIFFVVVGPRRWMDQTENSRHFVPPWEKRRMVADWFWLTPGESKQGGGDTHPSPHFMLCFPTCRKNAARLRRIRDEEGKMPWNAFKKFSQGTRILPLTCFSFKILLYISCINNIKFEEPLVHTFFLPKLPRHSRQRRREKTQKLFSSFCQAENCIIPPFPAKKIKEKEKKEHFCATSPPQ